MSPPMTRKTITVTEAAFEAADSDRDEDESWSEYLQRVADTEHTPNTVVVENIGEVARAVGDEVEDRMRTR